MRRRGAYGLLLLVGLLAASLLWSHPWQALPIAPAPPETPAPSAAGQLPRVLTGPVVHVVDGNTIDVQLDGRKVRVRYLGMNTPETKHPTKGQEPCGPEAAEANRRLVAGQMVRLELDVQPWDRYQRLLASVYVSDVMVNAELVRQGYAQMATYPPNVRYADRFRQVQQKARTARSGCWKAP
jgi:micrococcal nuclease